MTSSHLLGRHKLNASFDGSTVTHITRESNLEARQRLLEVKTVWTMDKRIGAGAFGVVWRQKADTGKLRAVKIISRDKLNVQEVEALIDLQDVCEKSGEEKKENPPPPPPICTVASRHRLSRREP